MALLKIPRLNDRSTACWPTNDRDDSFRTLSPSGSILLAAIKSRSIQIIIPHSKFVAENQGIHETGMCRVLYPRSQLRFELPEFSRIGLCDGQRNIGGTLRHPGCVYTKICAATPLVQRGGGVLAQAAMLLAHSDGQDAYAVNRGVWIRSRCWVIHRRIHPPMFQCFRRQPVLRIRGPCVGQAEARPASQGRHNVLDATKTMTHGELPLKASMP